MLNTKYMQFIYFNWKIKLVESILIPSEIFIQLAFNHSNL